MCTRMSERIRLPALITKHAYLCGRNYRVCPELSWPNKPEIGKKNCFNKPEAKCLRLHLANIDTLEYSFEDPAPNLTHVSQRQNKSKMRLTRL